MTAPDGATVLITAGITAYLPMEGRSRRTWTTLTTVYGAAAGIGADTPIKTIPAAAGILAA